MRWLAVIFSFQNITQFYTVSSSDRHVLYSILCAMLFFLHVGYLSLFKFDYGYNMAASVGAGDFR